MTLDQIANKYGVNKNSLNAKDDAYQNSNKINPRLSKGYGKR